MIPLPKIMKIPRLLPLLSAILLTPLLTSADVLELKDGRVLNGLYQGGTAGTLRFAVDGQMEVIPVSEVIALTIVRDGTTAATPATPAAPAAAAATSSATTTASSSAAVVIPAGETLIVRLRSTVSTRNARPGQKFDSVLENDLRAGEVIIAPRGSLVRGTVVNAKAPRRLNKSAALSLTLDEVQTPEGTLALHTQPHSVQTNERGSLVRGAAQGATIGLITGEDAGNAAGAGAAMAAVRKGDHIVFDSGSLITFTLDKPIEATGEK
jgi:hypothetical protein